jgi:HME family heavy-metal exporter
MKQYGVTLTDLTKAVEAANVNTGGGFLQTPNNEFLIRNLGRVTSLDALANSVVKIHSRGDAPILLKHVADVKFGIPVKRGDASVNAQPAVILSIQKQPQVNTLTLVEKIDRALDEIQKTLPKDVKINRHVFRQSEFIKAAIENVIQALRDAVIIVAIVLVVFLWNFRTAIISLTAVPMSFIITGLVFKWFGLSINTMTLGGLAIAIGELVDDSIVDVENVFRRLRENNQKPPEQRRHLLQVIYLASTEVRNSIVYATVAIIFVFMPLFSLGGMQGRIFVPLGNRLRRLDSGFARRQPDHHSGDVLLVAA